MDIKTKNKYVAVINNLVDVANYIDCEFDTSSSPRMKYIVDTLDKSINDLIKLTGAKTEE